jgi:hypothetical protein
MGGPLLIRDLRCSKIRHASQALGEYVGATTAAQAAQAGSIARLAKALARGHHRPRRLEGESPAVMLDRDLDLEQMRRGGARSPRAGSAKVRQYPAASR